MAYEILDNRNNTDLEQGLFASLTAIKGEQFGRELYSSVIKFKDLSDFLEIFPEVQRDIIPRRVASIRKYILSESPDNLRFFTSITVSCKGFALYDSTNKRLALDVANTKLSINDGQHRFEAIRTTLLQLEEDFKKSKDKEKTEELRNKIDRLEEMVIPIVLFNGLSETQEKQLFHDLNSLAQRPNKNANIKLNQTDYYAKLSRELAEYNRYLKHYGVETEKMSIFRNNKNTILLTTVYKSLRYLFSSRTHSINDENYQSYFDKANKWFDDVFRVLPNDLNTKEKYILDKSYGITSIFRFITKMTDIGVNKETILLAIGKIDYKDTNEVWKQYGGTLNSRGRMAFSGSTNGGERAFLSYLADTIDEYK
ncbi:DNA sulfur modification protein DndB [Lysinibacillus xylanilyticus]|uniref:DNA sulfur modification protein DndB n=1 Tax=Lysinibacillus xylanilyticus TaxID=582475 RepID=UPI0037F66BD6